MTSTNNALKYSVEKNNLKLAEYLLNKDDKPTNIEECLMTAIELKVDDNLIQLLLSKLEPTPINLPIPFFIHKFFYDMSPETKGIGNNSTLMCQIHTNPEQACKDLGSGKYSVEELNYRNEGGWSILSYLARNGRNVKCAEEMIRYLINNRDVDVNTSLNSGKTALTLAVLNSNTTSNENIVQMLLAHPNINVNLICSDGNSPLMYAAVRSSNSSTNKTVEMLLEHPDTNIMLKKSNGDIALTMALRTTKLCSNGTREMLLKRTLAHLNIQIPDLNIQVSEMNIDNICRALMEKLSKEERTFPPETIHALFKLF